MISIMIHNHKNVKIFISFLCGDLYEEIVTYLLRRLLHTRELHALVKAYDAILLTNAEIG